jgi:hypothetical protein
MDFPGVFSDHILPHKIHQINVSFIVDKLEKQFGGTAANIAYNIHLLSPGRALMLACVGQDGQAYLDWMRRLGLSTDAILVEKDLYTASGKVITDRNNNQIWGFYQQIDAVKGGYLLGWSRTASLSSPYRYGRIMIDNDGVRSVIVNDAIPSSVVDSATVFTTKVKKNFKLYLEYWCYNNGLVTFFAPTN